jgi:XTP/dITP diphosphohydrolase
MKLLVATHNSNKLIEIKAILEAHQIDLFTLDDLEIDEDIEETANTFEGNALLKAQWAHQRTGLACIADDSGLEIEALNNEPGVYSARYLGENTPYRYKNQIILERLLGQDNRNARYVCVVAYVDESGQSFHFRAELNGKIALESKGEGGFGYDPIFIPIHEIRHYAELNLDERNQISHRQAALKACIKNILEVHP